MERETRYTVFKITDVNGALTPDECTELIRLGEKIALWREQVGKQPLVCVVVENDWPEYDETWWAIAARMDGGSSLQSKIDQIERYGTTDT